MRNQKGFTLLELLIITAIVATIVAIAVPSLLKARTRSTFQDEIEFRPNAPMPEVYQPIVQERPCAKHEPESALQAYERCERERMLTMLDRGFIWKSDIRCPVLGQ